MSELRECPCGRPAVISAADIAGRRSAHCDDQDCYWSIVGFSDEQVTERWNRRPDPAPVGELPAASSSAEWGSGDWYVEELTILAGYLQGRGVGICHGAAEWIRRKNLNPQPGAAVGELASELRELVGDYWNLAYAEGAERRDQDTENHDAQRTILRIEEIIRTLTNTDKGS